VTVEHHGLKKVVAAGSCKFQTEVNIGAQNFSFVF